MRRFALARCGIICVRNAPLRTDKRRQTRCSKEAPTSVSLDHSRVNLPLYRVYRCVRPSLTAVIATGVGASVIGAGVTATVTTGGASVGGTVSASGCGVD